MNSQMGMRILCNSAHFGYVYYTDQTNSQLSISRHSPHPSRRRQQLPRLSPSAAHAVPTREPSRGGGDGDVVPRGEVHALTHKALPQGTRLPRPGGHLGGGDVVMVVVVVVMMMMM